MNPVGTAVGEVVVEWHGRRVVATRPARIAGLDLQLSTTVVRRTEQAAAAARLAGARGSGAVEVVARLLLRSEGLASSAIEGLWASPERVARAQVLARGGDSDGDAAVGTAAWVADNLAVVVDALADPQALGDASLWRWHVRLMRHAPDLAEEHRGAWRDRLGWVGGANPMAAAHVAASAEEIPAAMADLYAYAGRDDVDAVTQAAIVHAQFETIHPFADGNGRIGRVLIGRILAHRLGIAVPPPVSQVFARDIGGYLAGLTLYRQGDAQPWVSWFADAVRTAAERSEAVLDAVSDLTAGWDRRASHLRSDSTARRLLTALPAHPVVSAQVVADLLGVSTQAARGAMEQLADLDIVVESERIALGLGRPQRWWAAQELLELTGR